MSTPSILPFDAPNRQQIAQGHPPDWLPPRPKDRYDLVVLGGGPAGLTAAITAAKAGHAVAMVERNLTGGTCVNFGCTPVVPVRLPCGGRQRLSLGTGHLGVLTACWVRAELGAGPDRGRKAGPGMPQA